MLCYSRGRFISASLNKLSQKRGCFKIQRPFLSKGCYRDMHVYTQMYTRLEKYLILACLNNY